MKRLVPLLLGVIGFLMPLASFAAAPPAIRESVAVCDPNSPLHCQAPNSSGQIPVIPSLPINPATIYSAQQTVTTSAVALASQALSNGLVITADPTNSAAIYVGPSGVTTSTGYKLQPGASISYGVTNANAIYIVSAASTTDKISEAGN